MSTVKDQVTINGTTFNDPAAPYRVCDVMEGWESTPPLDFVVVPNGGGPGAVMGASVAAKEKYMTLAGAWLAADRLGADTARRNLLSAFPVGVEFPVTRYGRTRFCRLWDAVEPDLQTPRGFRWTAPVVALDPYAYDANPKTAIAGAFNGDDVYRTYAQNLLANPLDDSVAGWGTTGGSSGYALVNDSPAHSSAATLTAGGALAGVFSPTGLSGAPVREGVTYRYGADVKNQTGAASRTFEVQVIWYDAAGAQISGPTGTPLALTTAQGWGTVNNTAVAPVGARFAAVYPRATNAVAAEQFRFDNPFLTDDLTYTPPVGQAGSAGTSRVYDGTYGRIYTQPSAGTVPTSLGISNDGDALSRRVVATVSGPLAAGDWSLVNETTGDACTVTLDLLAGQSFTLDTATGLVTMNPGNYDATAQLLGEMLTLAPGNNTVRLIAGTDNPDARLTITAYATAWR